MRILIVGAGLSGCSLARILYDGGHDIAVIEKTERVGGLCVTDINEDGLKYEPFGARTFHTKDKKVIKFIKRFSSFNGYTHRKGMIISNKLFPFPITKEAISRFRDSSKIFSELKNLPAKIDTTNFETACISIFGPTLYRYFIENYTSKMWGCEPHLLTAEWAPKRLELRDVEGDVFAGQWQGLPSNGYSSLLEKMIEGIKVNLRTDLCCFNNYDLVISSAPIDELLDYRYGELQYRSLIFDYVRDDGWENDSYGTINLPQHNKYIRKCNFMVLHKQRARYNYIQYQEPVQAGDKHVPMYPVNTAVNNRIFNRYLKTLCRKKHIIPFGRLGLYKYLDMDKAVSVAFDIAELTKEYLFLSNEKRYAKIKQIRDKY